MAGFFIIFFKTSIMKILNNRFFIIILFIIRLSPAHSSETDSAKYKEAWQHWENGDFTKAEESARQLAKHKEFTQDALHIRINVLCAFGKYNEAVKLYNSLNSAYPKFTEVSGTLAEAYFHLNMPGESFNIYNSVDSLKKFAPSAKERYNNPLKLHSDKTYIVPFDEKALYVKFIPAIKGSINNTEALLRFDTGGTFIIMGVEDAKKYNIELTNETTGQHAFDKTKTWLSSAKSIKLGDSIIIENSPVIVMESLKNFIIFGTNILEQFLTTIDYPNNRFIFTPRGNETLINEHYRLLTGEKEIIPFYMINDHYMIAKGSFNNFENLNWFIDSGLLALKPDSAGNIKQAGLNISKESLIKFGYPEEQLTENSFYIEENNKVSLGNLVQNDLMIFYNGKLRNDRKFGGVKTQGLLSHAFLSKYTWTIDFDKHQYQFNY